LALIPTYMIIRDFKAMWICIAVLVAASIFLKKNWYDKLSD
jgi:hypothetical protein